MIFVVYVVFLLLGVAGLMFAKSAHDIKAASWFFGIAVVGSVLLLMKGISKDEEVVKTVYVCSHCAVEHTVSEKKCVCESTERHKVVEECKKVCCECVKE